MKVQLDYDKEMINDIEASLAACTKLSKRDADEYRYFVEVFKPYIRQGEVEITSTEAYFDMVRMISRCTDGEYHINSDGSIYIG